jgi:protein-S-isoprenylcysteine O-methyltransferase Ste14
MRSGEFEIQVRRLGALALLITLNTILWGVLRGLRRPAGRRVGQPQRIMNAPAYLAIGVPYFGACALLWRPLPLALSRPARIAALILGALLYFPGLALVLWGRLTLGRMYNVSSSFGAQLYADQQLVTRGPFAYVRHPMYLGILVASFGGLLLFRTWTLVFTTINFLALIVRARREEQALAAEFGERWQAYRQRVPGWLPRIRLSSGEAAS